MRLPPLRHPRTAYRVLLLAALGAAPAPLLAQEGSGSLLVHVVGDDSGRSLAGAQVLVQGMGIGGATNASGTLHLTRIQPGSRMVEVRFLGYAAARAQVTVSAGRESVVNFRLPLEPVRLAEVRVRSRRTRLAGTGFHQRKANGNGTFFTRDEIERMRPRTLSDVMRRVPGASVFSTGSGWSSANFRGGRRSCPVQFYVDGTFTSGMLMDEVRAEDVEALEIYRGAATLPPEFNKGSAMCGAIVIWTRER